MDLVYSDWNQCEIFTWKSMEVVTRTGCSISSAFEDLWKGYMRQTHPLLSFRHMGQNLQPIGLDCFVLKCRFHINLQQKAVRKSDRDTSNIMNIFSSSHSGWASIAQERNQHGAGVYVAIGGLCGLSWFHEIWVQIWTRFWEWSCWERPRKKCRTCSQMGLSQAPEICCYAKGWWNRTTSRGASRFA